MSQPKSGTIVWFDIPVSDFEKAKAFYGELFGWKFSAMGGTKNPEYWLAKVGEDAIGGFRKPVKPIFESDAPILYFTVDKLDPAITRAKNLGASIIGNTVDIGNNMGRYQWIRDRDQNLVGIWAQS